MKNNLAAAFLNLALAGLVFLCIGFTLLVIWREPRVPVFAATALQDNNNLMKVNAILNDTAAYNATAKDPELARILNSVQQKPATR